MLPLSSHPRTPALPSMSLVLAPLLALLLGLSETQVLEELATPCFPMSGLHCLTEFPACHSVDR